MQNNFVRTAIIIMIQIIVPVLLLLTLIPPLLSHSSQLHRIQQFFETHQSGFLFIHGLFYLILFLLWPRIVKQMANQQLDDRQIKIALSARWYLVTSLILFEILTLWR
ncbi:hypothetical protein [Legionella sp. CNM-4043-24]|uniref:hypothetical protein n=1 Tax=Legionella sp. CNM-4043-24 TaxID=3421646 RepID=UPI00403AF3A1